MRLILLQVTGTERAEAEVGREKCRIRGVEHLEVFSVNKSTDSIA